MKKFNWQQAGRLFIVLVLLNIVALEFMAVTGRIIIRQHLSVLVIAIIFSLILTSILTVIDSRRVRHLELSIDKLSLLADDQPDDGQIILKPNDDYYDLAQAINRVQVANTVRIKQMQQQSATMATLLENLPVGIMRIETDRTLSLVNRTATEILQIAEQAIDKAYDDVIHQHQVLSIIERALSSKKPQQRRISIQIDGHNKVLECSTVYYQTRPRHEALLVICYDITDLARLQSGQSEFVANASHELRTPLTAITGFTETLLAGAYEDENVRREFLQIIQDEAQHLFALTNDILALAKDNVVEQREEIITLQQKVTEIVRQQQKQIEQHNLTVENEIQSDVVFMFDESAIYQIVNNLIVNAIKYNRPGGSVKIDAKLRDKQLTIQVTDTGVGITSADQDRIFERFYRVDKARNKKITGTGLGLAIVQNIVAQAGGEITVNSQVGVGTTMTVVLPVK